MRKYGRQVQTTVVQSDASTMLIGCIRVQGISRPIDSSCSSRALNRTINYVSKMICPLNITEKFDRREYKSAGAINNVSECTFFSSDIRMPAFERSSRISEKRIDRISLKLPGGSRRIIRAKTRARKSQGGNAYVCVCVYHRTRLYTTQRTRYKGCPVGESS